MACRLSLVREASPRSTPHRLPQGVSVQPKHRIPTHPGEILREEFLAPLGQTQVALAEHLKVPVQRINELVRGKRAVTPETAWLLAQALNTPGCHASRSPGVEASPCILGRLAAQGAEGDRRTAFFHRPAVGRPWYTQRRTQLSGQRLGGVIRPFGIRSFSVIRMPTSPARHRLDEAHPSPGEQRSRCALQSRHCSQKLPAASRAAGFRHGTCLFRAAGGDP